MSMDLFEDEEPRVKKRGEHILVVDDERARRFDLVLTDMRMPGLDGVETLMGLKQLHPSMPVIVVTAYASGETAARCKREGAYGYVMKPFDLDELLRVIEEAAPTGKTPLQS